MRKQAIVVHSGGMDSSICLALAIKEFGSLSVLSLGFDYGQRHSPELAAAQRICSTWGVDRVVYNLGGLPHITDNALVNRAVPISNRNTLVVGRNGLMASIAAIYAEKLEVHDIYLGVIECDAVHTGYRDCSREYWDLKQQLMQWDLNDPTFTIHTPLVKMTKKETLRVADALGQLEFLLKETITCYEGLSVPGCMKCHACRLRAQGLQEYLTEKKTSVVI